MPYVINTCRLALIAFLVLWPMGLFAQVVPTIAIWDGGEGEWTDTQFWKIDGMPAGSDNTIPGTVFRDFWKVVIDDAEIDSNVFLVGAPTIPRIDELVLATGDNLQVKSPLVVRTDVHEGMGGRIFNSGNLFVVENGILSVGGSDTPPPDGGVLKLTGGGNLILDGEPGPLVAPGARIGGFGPEPRVLVNENNTISGTGQLGAGELLIVNRHLIVADQVGKRLIVDPDSGNGPSDLSNEGTGVLSAIGEGILELRAGRFLNGPQAKITANANSFVDLGIAAEIIGGKLQSQRNGLFRVIGSASLADLTVDGVVEVKNGHSLMLADTIDNRGNIALAAGDRNTSLVVDGDVTLDGNGSVNLKTSFRNLALAGIAARAPGAVLTVGQTQRITGVGLIGNGLTVVNQGTISANQNERVLEVRPASDLMNTGVLEARSGGLLHLIGSWNLTSKNSGDLKARDKSAVVLDGVRISLQRLGTPDNDTLLAKADEIDPKKGVIRTQAASSVIDVRNGPTFNQGLLEIAPGSALSLRSDPTDSPSTGPSLVNDGTIFLDANQTHNATINVVRGDIRLTGGGRIILSNSNRNQITQPAVDLRTNTLFNEDNTIEGTGNLGGTRLKIENGLNGTIRANAGNKLVIAPATAPRPENGRFGAGNSGVWEAVDGSQLTVRGGSFSNNFEGKIRAIGSDSLFLVDAAYGFLTVNSTMQATDQGRIRFSGSDVSALAAIPINVNSGGVLEIHDSTFESRTSTRLIAASGENSRIDLSGGTVIKEIALTTQRGAIIRNLDLVTLADTSVVGDFIGTNGSNTIFQEFIGGGRTGIVERTGRVFLSGLSKPTTLTIAQADETTPTPFRMRNLEIILLGSEFNRITGTETSTKLRMESGVIRGGGRISGLQLDIESPASIIADGMIPIIGSIGDDELDIAGVLSINTTNDGDTLENEGMFLAVDGGTLEIEDRRLRNSASGSIEIRSGSKLIAQELVNNGIFEVAADATVQLGGALEQSKGVKGVVPLSTKIAGKLSARSVRVFDSSMLIDGQVTVTGGNQAVRIDPGASLGGSGSINGTLISSGAFTPGQSAGKFTIHGDFEQLSGSELEIELAGTEAGAQYDQLSVDGMATLDGTVVVKRLDGFSAAAASTFEVISAATLVDRGFSLAMLDGSLFRPTVVDAGDGKHVLRLTTIDGVQHAPVSGSWEKSGDWPGGLLPGADDTVFIPGDPAADTIVTGPSTNTSVFALVVGSGDEAANGAATFDLSSGVVTATRGMTLRRDGRLTGDGTLEGNLYNAGTVASDNTPGAIHITGNYNQSEIGTLTIEIGGMTPGEEFDQLTVSGTATLSGTLDVDLINLGEGIFQPSVGDVFTIVNAADQVNGRFATVNAPPLVGGLGWKIDYSTMSVNLRAGLLGDFNDNGILDAADIDLLSAEASTLTNNLDFDLNNDQIVDQQDRAILVKDLRFTYFGDANLDGEFNSGDLVAVFQAGEYEDDLSKNSVWSTGDWNGDAEFGTGDLVLAFQDGGFGRGPRADMGAVPEPRQFWLLTVCLTSILIRRQLGGYNFR